jgi:ABC-type multidrug transport system fused ATPase/permease subunit
MKIKILEKVIKRCRVPEPVNWQRNFRSYLICNLLSKKKRRHSGSFSRFRIRVRCSYLGRFPDIEKVPAPLLQLSDVSFGYTPDKLILDLVNFDVSLDSRIAIVGANGAGKSTLWAQGHIAIIDDFISMVGSSYWLVNLRHCRDK